MNRTWLSRDEVRAIDRRAIADFGMPGVVLMENAGRGCAELLLGPDGLSRGGSVAICCGKGNNGGDGYVIARHLDNHGVRVEVFLACDPAELQGDAAIHFEIIRRSQLSITIASQPADWMALAARLKQADWIVDALLGTGFSGEPREPVATAIQTMNASGRPILAIDVPSGFDAETGAAAADCIRATRTATFVALKRGFVEITNSKEFTGPVEVMGIGAPRTLLTSCRLGQKLS